MSKDSQLGEKSRSQVKREFRELKDLGIELAGLTKGQLRNLPLSEKTREALLAAKQMTRTALQRQYRYIPRLLAEEDLPSLRAALANALRPHEDEIARLHEAELWRDRLLSDDDHQITAFVERHPDCDRMRLRQMVRNAKKERSLDKPPKSARQLFRYIRQLSEP